MFLEMEGDINLMCSTQHIKDYHTEALYDREK